MHLQEITSKPSRIVIGLMSGTSADGVDAAVVQIEGSGESTRVSLLGFECYPLPPQVKLRILGFGYPSACAVEELCRLNVLLGELFAEAAKMAAHRAGLELKDVDLIGSHGQTVCHLPVQEVCCGYDFHSTLQIGEPCVIAERTGVTTVADFRQRDMAAGGQGAPLAPLADYLLFRSPDHARGMLNIGGIANITVLPKGCGLGDVVAFDTGPGNMVIDHLVALGTSGQQGFDREGAIGASGKVHEPLLAELMTHPFVKKRPPKSAGRAEFGEVFSGDLYERTKSRGLSDQDIIATATAFTATAVHETVARFAPCPIDQLVVSGGGVHNTCLMGHLERLFDPVAVMPLEQLGMSSDAKEAVAFAVLANETLFVNPGNVPQVTGASHAAVLGKIVPGQ